MTIPGTNLPSVPHVPSIPGTPSTNLPRIKIPKVPARPSGKAGITSGVKKPTFASTSLSKYQGMVSSSFGALKGKVSSLASAASSAANAAKAAALHELSLNPSDQSKVLAATNASNAAEVAKKKADATASSL
jgi:hypothetical protein